MNVHVRERAALDKKRSMQAICKALFVHLEETSGEDVSYDDLVADHIGKGRLALEIYLKSLNSAPLFAEDSLGLEITSIVAHPTVEELLATIFDAYKSRDWIVYYA